MVSRISQTRFSKNLQAHKDKFFTLSLDMFLIVGFDGYLKHLNPMCQKILGFGQTELLSQPWLEFVHPEDRSCTLVQLEKLAAGADTVTFENRCRTQDGSYKWLLWNAASCGEEKLIYAAARDITERKQAEEALKESEEGFRLLVSSVKDYAIYMLDPNGKVISWNQGAQRINGYQAQEIIGQHVSCFHPLEDIASGKPQQVLDFAAQMGRYEYETKRLRQDGSHFWADVVVTPLQSAEGKLRGFATVTRDITERKQAQEALEAAYNDLERRVAQRTAQLQAANELLKQEISDRKRTESALRESKALLKQKTQQLEETLHELHSTQAQLIQNEKMSSLGQLVAGIAHEINNPVSFIYGNIDHAQRYFEDLLYLLSLYRKYYPQPVAEINNAAEAMDFDFILADLPSLLCSMKLGAERIRQIVLSLRNFARHDEAQMKAVDIHQGLDSTLKLLQNRLKGRHNQAGIQVIQAYSQLPPVQCHAGLLNQVFMHLLCNAIEALEGKLEPRIIEIKTDLAYREQSNSTGYLVAPKPYILIRIRDNGPGISEEIQHKLFDPFFTTKPLGKNTGLGLYLSYQIVVKKHGGQLRCISAPNQGTEFWLEIPLEATSGPASTRSLPIHIPLPSSLPGMAYE